MDVPKNLAGRPTGKPVMSQFDKFPEKPIIMTEVKNYEKGCCGHVQARTTKDRFVGCWSAVLPRWDRNQPPATDRAVFVIS